MKSWYKQTKEEALYWKDLFEDYEPQWDETDLVHTGLKGTMEGEKNPMYGRKHTEETKMLMRELKQGYKPHNTGKKLSEQHRKAISEGLTGLGYKRYPCGKLTGGTKWWNNGVSHKRCIESPGDEWVIGRINKGNLGGARYRK